MDASKKRAAFIVGNWVEEDETRDDGVTGVFASVAENNFWT